MSWQGIVGHDRVVEQFRTALRRGRMASTFLFVGPEGVGKRSAALALAKAMLCMEHSESELAACGRCSSCVQAAAGTHPDILQVAKPADKSMIPVDLLIGDRDHRMRVGLVYEIGLKPFLGKRKFAIIDDADFMNEEGANSLLKTLEEPPPGSVLILISTSLQRQLPTIRSRCQVIRFAPLATESIADLLVEQGKTDDRQAAVRAAESSEGSLTQALAALRDGTTAAKRPLLAALTRGPLSIALVEAAFEAFISDGGDKKSKNKQAGRDRSRQALLLAADFYRQWLRTLSGAKGIADAEVCDFVSTAAANCQLDTDQVMQCLDRVLEAMRQVDRNAYAKLWPLSLAADLAAIYAGEHVCVAEQT